MAITKVQKYIPDSLKQFFSNVRLANASSLGSDVTVFRETKHISISDLSEPKPEIVEPTKYKPKRGYELCEDKEI